MNCYEVNSLSMGQAVELKPRLRIVARQREAPDGSRGVALEVTLGDQPPVDLRGAVDTSGGPGEMGTNIILGDRDESMFVMGGPAAYRWSIPGEPECVALYRDPKHEEYWETRMIAVPCGVLVVYEAGVMLVDGDARVRWHKAKKYNDVLHEVDPGLVSFVGDNGQRWSIALEDGAESGSR